MDVQLLLQAAQSGLALYEAAGGGVSDADKAKIAAGASIIAASITLFGAVKGELSATDVAAAEAGLAEIRARAQAHVDRVIEELSEDASI